MQLLRSIFFAALLLVASVARAQDIPARPSPSRLVNDFAGVLSADERNRLEQRLVAYDDSTSNQITIVTVPTLNNYPIEEYALKLFRAWGIGNKKTNNGILILTAVNDRKIRIEVGYGLEGAIPDITANQIIQHDIAPKFRSGDYAEGYDSAAASLIKAAAGEYKAPEGYRKKNAGSGRGIGIAILIVIIIVALSGFGRGGGGGGFLSRRGYRSGGFGGPLLWGGGLGGGGGGWSGGGGGGFGGFGGGSSGGGGASGSW